MFQVPINYILIYAVVALYWSAKFSSGDFNIKVLLYNEKYMLVLSFVVSRVQTFSTRILTFADPPPDYHPLSLYFRLHIWLNFNYASTGCFIIYDTITKCNNFTCLQQIIFIYVLYCSWMNIIYAKK